MSCWTCSQQGCFLYFRRSASQFTMKTSAQKTDIFTCRVGSTDGSFARKPSLKRLASAVRRGRSRRTATGADQLSQWILRILLRTSPVLVNMSVSSAWRHSSAWPSLLSAFWASPHADQQWIRLDLNKRRIPASWTVSRLPCSSCSTTAKLSSSLATSETAEMRTNSLSTSARSAVATNSSSVT